MGTARIESRREFEEERALRAVVEGTAAAIGEVFFRNLVRALAEALGVRYAFVAEFTESKKRVRTLAFWDHNDWRENVEYALAGTPCEQVLAGRLCHYPDHVQGLFPEDRDLVALQAESYLGVPLLSASGEILGHLAALDRERLEAEFRSLSIFRIFAQRACAELERQRVDRELEIALRSLERRVAERTAELRNREAELRAVLAISQAVTQHLKRDELFGAVAGEIRSLIPIHRMSVVLPSPDKSKVVLYALDEPLERAGVVVGDAHAAQGTVSGWVIAYERPLLSATRAELEARFPSTYSTLAEEGLESLIAMPLLRRDSCIGCLSFASRERGVYTAEQLPLMEQIAKPIAVAVDNCVAYEEIARLKDRLLSDNVYLQEEIRLQHNFEEIVGSSDSILNVLRQVERVAPTLATVLITGETGTGKELIARAIHARSHRKDRPLVKVNCAAISAGLVESELFGHVKGAFTGAVDNREGRFGLADGGTIFLDEIGELPQETQVKLLRVLQEREFEPVGSNNSRRVDVRIIAATNRNLELQIQEGRFRSDLYYRLNVVPIHIPPLRAHREDVPQLVRLFMERFAKSFSKDLDRISPETMELLVNYSWPGNVRELQNVIERAVVLAHGKTLELDDSFLPNGRRESGPPAPSRKTPERVEAPLLPAAPVRDGESGTERPAETNPPGALSLEDIQRRHIAEVLGRTKGVIDGPRGAARILNVHPNTLRSRLKKLGIDPRRNPESGAKESG